MWVRYGGGDIAFACLLSASWDFCLGWNEGRLIDYLDRTAGSMDERTRFFEWVVIVVSSSPGMGGIAGIACTGVLSSAVSCAFEIDTLHIIFSSSISENLKF